MRICPGWYVKVRHLAGREFEVLKVGRKFVQVLDLNYYQRIHDLSTKKWIHHFLFADLLSYKETIRGSFHEAPWVNL